MRFGPVPPAEALGAINVHTLRAGERVIKKGLRLAADEIAALVAARVEHVVCARADDDELDEDTAAARLATALAGSHVAVDRAHTGRANVRATAPGVFIVDRDAIDRTNQIDEALTVATIAPDTPVRAGDIVATIKTIPFAVPAATVASACAVGVALSVAPFTPRSAGLVLTRFTATHPRSLDRAAAAQRIRVERIGGTITREVRIDHDPAVLATNLRELADAGLDPILVLGASAIVDRRDVIPAAIVRAGGTIVRHGMPADPGNLVLVGTLGRSTVFGLPGCARSLDRSGFDWLLERHAAGLPITARAIGQLGVGGLIMDAPRTSQTPRPAGSVAAIVLAAGSSTRMGEHKLLADLDGVPLVRHAVTAALASHARPVVVVTGNGAEDVRAALAGLDVVFVDNPAFATGMASSLRAGIAAVPTASAAMILLGDMPRIRAAHIDVLASAFAAAEDERAIVVPTLDRKRGHPVVLGRAHFAAIAELTGDVGARPILERNAPHIVTVPFDDPAILLDVDTPEALAKLRR